MTYSKSFFTFDSRIQAKFLETNHVFGTFDDVIKNLLSLFLLLKLFMFDSPPNHDFREKSKERGEGDRYNPKVLETPRDK